MREAAGSVEAQWISWTDKVLVQCIAPGLAQSLAIITIIIISSSSSSSSSMIIIIVTIMITHIFLLLLLLLVLLLFLVIMWLPEASSPVPFDALC